MDKYLPVLIVGAIIGIFTIAFLLAYVKMKKDKSYKEFERNMSDSQLIKRLLGYSSIGQAGFILVFFLDLNGPVVFLVSSYLLAYALSTIAAFFAVAMVRTQRGSEEIAAFRGLGTSNPRTAFLITVCFASLAGVPLTFGFLVKMYAFVAAISTIEAWCGICWLLPIMIITAATGFYYYFKVIRAMYWEKPQAGDKPLCVPLCTGIVMTLCVLALIYLGTMPLITMG